MKVPKQATNMRGKLNSSANASACVITVTFGQEFPLLELSMPRETNEQRFESLAINEVPSPFGEKLKAVFAIAAQKGVSPHF